MEKKRIFALFGGLIKPMLAALVLGFAVFLWVQNSFADGYLNCLVDDYECGWRRFAGHWSGACYELSGKGAVYNSGSGCWWCGMKGINGWDFAKWNKGFVCNEDEIVKCKDDQLATAYNGYNHQHNSSLNINDEWQYLAEKCIYEEETNGYARTVSLTKGTYIDEDGTTQRECTLSNFLRVFTDRSDSNFSLDRVTKYYFYENKYGSGYPDYDNPYFDGNTGKANVWCPGKSVLQWTSFEPEYESKHKGISYAKGFDTCPKDKWAFAETHYTECEKISNTCPAGQYIPKGYRSCHSCAEIPVNQKGSVGCVGTLTTNVSEYNPASEDKSASEACGSGQKWATNERKKCVPCEDGTESYICSNPNGVVSFEGNWDLGDAGETGGVINPIHIGNINFNLLTGAFGQTNFFCDGSYDYNGEVNFNKATGALCSSQEGSNCSYSNGVKTWSNSTFRFPNLKDACNLSNTDKRYLWLCHKLVTVNNVDYTIWMTYKENSDVDETTTLPKSDGTSVNFNNLGFLAGANCLPVTAIEIVWPNQTDDPSTIYGLYVDLAGSSNWADILMMAFKKDFDTYYGVGDVLDSGRIRFWMWIPEFINFISTKNMYIDFKLMASNMESASSIINPTVNNFRNTVKDWYSQLGWNTWMGANQYIQMNVGPKVTFKCTADSSELLEKVYTKTTIDPSDLRENLSDFCFYPNDIATKAPITCNKDSSTQITLTESNELCDWSYYSAIATKSATVAARFDGCHTFDCTPDVAECVSGTYLPAETNACVQCPADEINGYYCPGGYAINNYDTDQGISECPSRFNMSQAGNSTIDGCYTWWKFHFPEATWTHGSTTYNDKILTERMWYRKDSTVFDYKTDDYYNMFTKYLAGGTDAPTRPNHQFKQWLWANSDNENDYTPIYSNTQLKAGSYQDVYAKWIRNQYDVVYECGTDASGTPPATQQVNFGSTFIPVNETGADCSKNGYSFSGWTCRYLDGDDGTEGTYFYKNSTYNNEADAKCTAIWRAKLYEILLDNNHNDSSGYTQGDYVVFEKYGTAWYKANDFGSVSDNNLAQVAIEVPTRQVYKFSGYYTCPEATGESNCPKVIGDNGKVVYSNATTLFDDNSTDLTLYAGWAVSVTEVTLDPNYYSSADSITPISVINNASTVTDKIYEEYGVNWYYYVFGTKYDMTAYSHPILDVPRSSTHLFDGYYTGKAGTGQKVIDKNRYLYTPYTNLFTGLTGTLYANWISCLPDGYETDWDLDGKHIDHLEVRTSVEYAGTTVTDQCKYTAYCKTGYKSNQTSHPEYIGGITSTAHAAATESDFSACESKIFTVFLNGYYYSSVDDTNPTGVRVTNYNDMTKYVYEKYGDGFYQTGSPSGKIEGDTTFGVKPRYTGYTFGGYYTGKAGTGTQVFTAEGKLADTASSTMFSENSVNLFSKWTPTEYEIMLDGNNATSTDYTTEVYETYNTQWSAISGGTPITEIDTLPTRDGYTFIGYFKNGFAVDGGSYDILFSDNPRYIGTDKVLPANTTFTSSKTLQAIWLRDCVNEYCQRTITEKDNKIEIRYTTNCPEYYVVTGGENTYNPTCRLPTYTITLVKNGGNGMCGNNSGTWNGIITCTAGSDCILPTWTDTDPKCNITKGDKILAGWANNQYSAEPDYELGANIKDSINGDKTLYAIWKEPICTVVNGQGSPRSTTTNTPTCYVTCDTGYKTSSTYYGIQNETSVYYECAAETYTITLDSTMYADNSVATATSAGTGTIYEKYNDAFYKNLNNDTGELMDQIAGDTTITIPMLTGYTFLGYYTTKATGGYQIITADGKIASGITATEFSASTTLYAHWQENQIYLKWFYDAINDNPYEENTCIYGKSKDENDDPDGVDGDINVPQISRPGYVFNGWKLSSVN